MVQRSTILRLLKQGLHLPTQVCLLIKLAPCMKTCALWLRQPWQILQALFDDAEKYSPPPPEARPPPSHPGVFAVLC